MLLSGAAKRQAERHGSTPLSVRGAGAGVPRRSAPPARPRITRPRAASQDLGRRRNETQLLPGRHRMTHTPERAMTPDELLRSLHTTPLTDRIGNTPLVPIGGPRRRARRRCACSARPSGSTPAARSRTARRGAWCRRPRRPARSARAGPCSTRRRATPASPTPGSARARLLACRLCLPANASAERQRLLEALGAELVLTDRDGRHRRRDPRGAPPRGRASPERYFYPDQYSNPANWQAHYAAPPRRSGGRPRAASRTWSPASAPRARWSAPRGGCASCNPAIEVDRGPARLAAPRARGAQAPAERAVPADLRPRRASAHDRRSRARTAIDMAQRQARRGLLLGWSAGAALVAARALARDARRTAWSWRSCPTAPSATSSDPMWRERIDEPAHRAAETLDRDMHAQLSRAYPEEGCGVLLGRDDDAAREVDARGRARQRARGRARTPLPDRARAVPRRRARGARRRARRGRLLPFASRPSGAAVGVRPRARVAVLFLPDRERRATARVGRHDARGGCARTASAFEPETIETPREPEAPARRRLAT